MLTYMLTYVKGSPEEESRLLAVCPEWLKDIIIFAMNTGMRQGEILGIEWSHVDLFRKTTQAERCVVNEIPGDKHVPAKTWDEQTQRWSDVKIQLRSAIDALPDSKILFHTAVGTTVASSGFMTKDIYTIIQRPENTTALNATLEHYAQVVHSRGWAEQAERELKRFGFDKAIVDRKNPIEQIQAAEAAFNVPSKPEADPTAVLIPLREAIEITLEVLIKRRPKQEPAKGWSKKILSVCKQAARHGFNETYFQRIVIDAEKLNDDLSAAKQEKMSRYEIRILLDRSVAFLVELLSLLDHERLNKP